MRLIALFLKKLDKNATNSFRINQEGDSDISIVFNEKDVSRLQKSLYLKQKRKISAKERLRLTETLCKAREMRKLDVIKNENKQQSKKIERNHNGALSSF